MNKEALPMEVYLVDIPYEEDTENHKRRPALVVGMSGRHVKLLKVTSEYDDKPKRIQNIYYPITEWQHAGLLKQSYVDCHRTYNITTDYILRNRPVATLTSADKTGLYSFINNLVQTGKLPFKD